MKHANKDVGRKMFKEAGLPDGLLDFLTSENSETSKTNFEKAVNFLDGFRNEIKKGLLSGNNTKVIEKTTTATSGLKEPKEGASREEWKAYFAAKK